MSEIKRSAAGTDITLFGDEHVEKYRQTNGEVGYLWNGVPILLLTTTGCRSRQPRVIPIIFTPMGDAWVIVASKGGAPTHPAWYLNILADPQVQIQIKSEKFEALARTAEPPERKTLWLEAVRAWPSYEIYQSRTTRNIPVVVLERRPG